MQTTADVHEASQIAADDAISPRLFDGGQLALEHPVRNIRVLDRKEPAEPAAFLLLAQLGLAHAFDTTKNRQRLAVDAEAAQQMTGRVVRDRGRKPAAETIRRDLGDELTEFPASAGDAAGF